MGGTDAQLSHSSHKGGIIKIKGFNWDIVHALKVARGQ